MGIPGRLFTGSWSDCEASLCPSACPPQAGMVDKKVGAVAWQQDFKIEAMYCDGGIPSSLHPALVCL